MADKLSRMHTAEHIFFKSLEKQVKDLKLDKISLDEKESTLYVFAKELTIQQILEAEKLANSIINEHRDIIEHFYEKDNEELIKLIESGKLRIKLERIKDEKIRVIEVKGFDLSACTCAHVRNTKEIGSLFISSFNAVGKGQYEIKFKLDAMEDLSKLAGYAREIKSFLNIGYDDIISLLQNLKKENEFMREKIRGLSKTIEIKINEEKLPTKKGIITFKHAVFPGINKKDFVEKVTNAKGDNAVICFINEEANEPRKHIAILCGENTSVDAEDILNMLSLTFDVKGGGNKQLAQGSFIGESKKIHAKLKEMLSN